MIYFIRHGESEANLRGVFAGQKEDSILTEKGRLQAIETAENLKSLSFKIDRIISSPLKRTTETAEIIAKEIGFPVNQIEIDDRITEYDMGSLTGTPIKKISSMLLISALNAESTIKFHDRIFSCMKELSNSPKNILVVSHAGVGRILEAVKLNIEINLFYDIPAYPNASINKIDWIK